MRAKRLVTLDFEAGAGGGVSDWVLSSQSDGRLDDEIESTRWAIEAAAGVYAARLCEGTWPQVESLRRKRRLAEFVQWLELWEPHDAGGDAANTELIRYTVITWRLVTAKLILGSGADPGRMIREAVRLGATWGDVGASLDCTAQGAHRRYSDRSVANAKRAHYRVGGPFTRDALRQQRSDNDIAHKVAKSARFKNQ